VLAFLRAMLEAAGHRVHLYSSPHLNRFHERIRLAGAGRSAPIVEDDLTAVLEECEAANGGAPITFFEITTVAAFLAFVRVPADVLLLEVGLGGRLDATNVVPKPVATGITPVSVDHVGYLGTDLGGIAREKAGILRQGVPAVIGPQPPRALTAIEAWADEVGAPLSVWASDWFAEEEDGELMVQSGERRHKLVLPALEGPHQIVNAGHAVTLLDHAPFRVDPAAMVAGMTQVDWPGRLQRLDSGPLAARLPLGSELWLDGGHNPASARALVEAARVWRRDETRQRPLYLVVALLGTKDHAGFVAALAEMATHTVAVPMPGEHVSLAAEVLAEAALGTGMTAETALDVPAALDAIAIRAASGPPPRVLICGSLLLAGAVLAADGRAVD
jgi:dihydrofolate synthase/folylpolyglutamate synthase